MPGFANLGEAAIQAVSALLLTGENRAAEVRSAQPLAAALRYTVDGYNKFLDPDGYPAIAPPWGTLNAINLDTGEYAWKIPLGEYPELAAKGVPNTGTENHGGGASLRREDSSSSAPRRRTASFARSTKGPAACCGKPRCLSAATLLPRCMRSGAGSTW